MISEFRKLPVDVQALGLAALAFAGFVVWDQWHWWNNREDYSFGFLVPLFVGYVLYERWPRLRAFWTADARSDPDHPPDPRLPASAELPLQLIFGACLAVGLLAFLLGSLYKAALSHALPATSLLAGGLALIILGLAWIASGSRAALPPPLVGQRLTITLLFTFPAFIWVISAPMVTLLEQKVSLFLLGWVSVIVHGFFDLAGFAILREGNVLIMPSGTVGVADACSGIRSLMACLFAGSFLGAVFLDRFWKKAALVLSAMFFAFLMNIVRSLILTGWAYRYGADSIEGLVHDVTGYGVLGVTCVGLIALLPLFNMDLEAGFDDSETTGTGDPDEQPV